MLPDVEAEDRFALDAGDGLAHERAVLVGGRADAELATVDDKLIKLESDLMVKVAAAKAAGQDVTAAQAALDDMKAKLEKLKTDLRKLSNDIRDGAPEDQVGTTFSEIHEQFHHIMEAWNGSHHEEMKEEDKDDDKEEKEHH